MVNKFSPPHSGDFPTRRFSFVSLSTMGNQRGLRTSASPIKRANFRLLISLLFNAVAAYILLNGGWRSKDLPPRLSEDKRPARVPAVTEAVEGVRPEMVPSCGACDVAPELCAEIGYVVIISLLIAGCSELCEPWTQWVC